MYIVRLFQWCSLYSSASNRVLCSSLYVPECTKAQFNSAQHLVHTGVRCTVTIDTCSCRVCTCNKTNGHTGIKFIAGQAYAYCWHPVDYAALVPTLHVQPGMQLTSRAKNAPMRQVGVSC